MNFWAANAAIPHKSNLFSRYLSPMMIVKTRDLQDTSASIFLRAFTLEGKKHPWVECLSNEYRCNSGREEYFLLSSFTAGIRSWLERSSINKRKGTKKAVMTQVCLCLWLYSCFLAYGHQRSYNFGKLRLLPDFLSHSKESSQSVGNWKLLWSDSLDRNKACCVGCSKGMRPC